MLFSLRAVGLADVTDFPGCVELGLVNIGEWLVIKMGIVNLDWNKGGVW